MKKTILLAGILGLALAVPFANAADPMSQKLSNLQGDEFSKEYAKHMIKHHQQGIEMAKLVKHHSQNRQLVQLSEKMVDGQQREIDELKRLKSHHEGSGAVKSQQTTGHSRPSTGSTTGSSGSHSSGSSGHASSDSSRHEMGGHGEMEQMHRESMAKLEAAQGQEFDRLFIEEMSKHHKMAIEMNKLAESRADRDLVGFAQKSSLQQQQEVQQLQQLNSRNR